MQTLTISMPSFVEHISVSLVPIKIGYISSRALEGTTEEEKKNIGYITQE